MRYLFACVGWRFAAAWRLLRWVASGAPVEYPMTRWQTAKLAWRSHQVFWLLRWTKIVSLEEAFKRAHKAAAERESSGA